MEQQTPPFAYCTRSIDGEVLLRCVLSTRAEPLTISTHADQVAAYREKRKWDRVLQELKHNIRAGAKQ